ncbi:hypothetical protein GGE65_001149 [Skermanella aerolata]|uniref:DUF6271 family protein n=1 Tax=Skermanella aerolata TaxID=393310 RepID=UPI003D1CAED3
MPANLIYVPTDRQCADQVEQLAQEALLIRERTGSCLVALIEHADRPWSGAHRDALAAARTRHGIDVAHMNWAGTAAFLRAVVDGAGLLANERERLLTLLHPREAAYGAGPNKAALLAAAVGARVLHRRDSDVRIDDRPGLGPAYPCVLELQAIDARVVELDLEVASGTLAAADIVSFVGTDAFGSAVHDRRDLLAVDVRHVVEIELLASPDASREALMRETDQYMVSGPDIRHDRDFFEEDVNARTCVGASTIADIFLELPEMPIRGTLGSDYLRRNALRFLGRPIIYHSRKVLHRYDATRAGQCDLDAVVDYARRDLRHMIVWPVLVAHHRTLRARPADFLTTSGGVDTAAYLTSLLAALEASMPIMTGMPTAFATIYRTAAGETDDAARRGRLLAVAEAVEHGPDFVEEVAQGIHDFAFLIRHWPALVASARCTPLPEAILL